MATATESKSPPTIPAQQSANDTGTAMTNGKGLAEEERNVVLLFGCQWLTFTASDFRQLRATVLDNPEHHWMLEVLGELPGYYRAAADDKYLPDLKTISEENDLQVLDRWFRCDDVSAARFPLCYTQLAPLLMMTHFVQYAQWMKMDDGGSAVVEIVGFCIGLLSSVVVSATRAGDLKRYGSVALRLAMLLGALGDVQEAQEKYTSLAVAWKEPELKGELDGVLEKYPGSYITVQYDENRATIMTPRRSMSDLQQTLQSAGFSANAVEFNGRYHWAGNEEILAALFTLCNDQPGLQLPDASGLLHPPRANATGDPVCSGPLHQLVLRAVLTQQCQWHKTFSAMYQDHLTTLNSTVIEFGPERCIPPTIFRRLPQRVVHFVDTEFPIIISRDHELATRAPADTNIAIVGMACHVAGADDLPEFWDLLCSGRSQHREMPRERYANYETPWRPEASQRAWFGNFVRDIDAFDHKFFKKSPREAMSQDPQQRLLLQVAYQALESAGYFSNPPPRKDIGCYIASCTVGYEHNVNCHPASAYSATGLLRSFLAGKLSHHFGWRGPSLCVDTACSESAVTLHHACQAILSGDCSAALVGGANAITSPLAFDNLAGASFLSPTGPCKPFDERAGGYCRGEGFAAIYIKKLSDAIAHGDQVLATIAGTAVEQNSNSTPIVVPDRGSLAGLSRKVMQRARLYPRDISVVETHGTGTQAGDPVEYKSVRDTLGGPVRAAKLSLGSVKGLVGHTEGVSGMIALCKIVLMIQHGQIPPQPGFDLLNSHVEAMEDDNIEITTSVRPWDVG
ncbi:thiolase-like protein [Aspergillus multicolor]|uniref:thiolase-like protein n=1 Tax=Aspergillus multicolor TaxID=41759 RepID=UPI003CCE18A2